MIESRGSLFMYKSEFVAVTAVDGVSILAYRVDTDGSFLEAENSTFTCPIGFTSKNILPLLDLGCYFHETRHFIYI